MCVTHAACRDHSVKLWCNDEQNGAIIYKPLETRLEHKVVLVKVFQSLHECSSSDCDCARDHV